MSGLWRLFLFDEVRGVIVLHSALVSLCGFAGLGGVLLWFTFAGEAWVDAGKEECRPCPGKR